MTSLSVAEELDDDLDGLVATHEADVGLIDALIEELAQDEHALATLANDVPKWCSPHFNPPYEIKKFQEAWAQGRRIYVLKPYDEEGHLIGFRLFVGHDINTDEFFALSVQPTSSCYDTSTDAYAALCGRYDRLGVPPIV